ncbi:MAG: hypothetical protein ACYCSN_08025 [Acidobacteriaceae bacterium]
MEDQQSPEEMQAERATAAATAKGPTPQDAHAKRRRQELELQRERVLSERTSNPHRRAALTAALEEIELKLAEFGWSIHV